MSELAGTAPRRQLAKLYNKQAQKLGYPERSHPAVREMLVRLEEPVRAVFDNWSMSEVCRVLQISLIVVQKHWRRHGLEIEQGGRTCMISRKSLRRFARLHPNRMNGCHPEGLMLLLDDTNLVAEILACGQHTKGRKHKVVCVETGEIFDSLTAAAKAKFVDTKTIYNSVHESRSCWAGTFKLLSVDAPDYSEYKQKFPTKSELKARVFKLRLQGLDMPEISRELGIGLRVVSRYLAGYVFVTEYKISNRVTGEKTSVFAVMNRIYRPDESVGTQLSRLGINESNFFDHVRRAEGRNPESRLSAVNNWVFVEKVFKLIPVEEFFQSESCNSEKSV